MNHPQDPFGHNSFRSEPVLDYPEDLPAGPRTNTLATLSLVFAFAFAPAGVLLGHLGLAQIRRTGQRGRDRALAGLTLSYAIIALAVIVLAAWTTLPGTIGNRTAAPTVTVPATSTPAVTADELPKLLPGVDEVERITGDRNVTAGRTWDRVGRYDKDGTIDREECWGSIGPGTPDDYNSGALYGFYASMLSDSDPNNTIQVIQGVAALRDTAAAQKQLASLLSGWQQCGGADVKVTFPSGRALTFSVGTPTDAGDGITTMELKTQGVQRRSVRAIATRANVIIDLDVTYSVSDTANADKPKQTAVAIAKYIFGKIPG